MEYRMYGLVVKKGMDDRADASTLRWFGHMEGMRNSMTAKRVYERECTGNCLVD